MAPFTVCQHLEFRVWITIILGVGLDLGLRYGLLAYGGLSLVTPFINETVSHLRNVALT